MQITIVAGARPNFMKIAPIIEAIEKSKKSGKNIAYRLVHTGQHYDKNMSADFFEQLGIPEPHINLECGGGTQAEQAAHIMMAFEKDLLANRSDLVLVVGDVTSTMACSIVAKKLLVKVAHVEAGIRSFDLTMPEEINRMVTDILADYFFTTSERAGENLVKTGIDKDRIFFVGNTMIDTLLKQQHRFKPPPVWNNAKLQSKNYLIVTLHRPANVDQKENLEQILLQILHHTNSLPVVFPVHPRTKKMLDGLQLNGGNLITTEPLPYLEFNYLVQNSKAVITDSGGITEETTVMGIPCLTLRDNTERPETIEIGTNELIGTNPESIAPALTKLFNGQWKKGSIPAYWDGQTATRITGILCQLFNA